MTYPSPFQPRYLISFMIIISLIHFVSPAWALESFEPLGFGNDYPASANGSSSETPSLPAARVANGSLTIDGHLDEASWALAPTATGFTQYEPERGATAAEQTAFKVAYDDDAIYFAVACLRTNDTPITSCLSRRDQITSSDMIKVYISPYNDLTTGYSFRINPHGVKEDYYNFGDLYSDRSWNAVWDADTSQDENGWYAEIRIPFSSVRYTESESMTWGFNVFQYIHSLGQNTAWSNWSREQSGFMSRSGTITDINGIRPPRQLEVLPYVVARVTDPADPDASGYCDEDWEEFGNFGMDIKYGITPDLTLSATVQPDFGQVEADPSQLNLSPFETYYQEKRPFFVEGAQFFHHPDNMLFYSRRIGTGTQNSRIRAAAKLMGKVAGKISTAVLFAATDETGNGQAHNFLKGGDSKSYYGIARLGTQFNEDRHSVNIMGTAVLRDGASFNYQTRNGYTAGADFKLNFKDRMYQLTGSGVLSIIDWKAESPTSDLDPDAIYGHGTRFELEKRSGDWRWNLITRTQSDKLDINDLGYISSPDNYSAIAGITRLFNGDGEKDWYTSGQLSYQAYKSWVYADRSVDDPSNPGSVLWSYSSGHSLLNSHDLNGYLELQNRWGIYYGANYNPNCTDLYATRYTPDWSQRGPLMSTPDNYHGWLGIFSDSRRDFSFSFDYKHWQDDAGSKAQQFELESNWVVSDKLTCEFSTRYKWLHEDAQHMLNVSNPGGGIGDVSYTFGSLDQQIWDVTLRSSFLFDRDRSLELYVQPYLTVGDYENLRELARPDSYSFRPYDGYDIQTKDFSLGAVNLNLVYRWEYRPGSTVYLVWTHARSSMDQRLSPGTSGSQGNGFDSDLNTRVLFDNEAENTFLLKISYWFPI